MNYWMFALIGIGCIFIVFVGVSIYILWSVKDLPCILPVITPRVFRHFRDLWAGRVLLSYAFLGLKSTFFNSQHEHNLFCLLFKQLLKLELFPQQGDLPSLLPRPRPLSRHQEEEQAGKGTSTFALAVNRGTSTLTLAVNRGTSTFALAVNRGASTVTLAVNKSLLESSHQPYSDYRSSTVTHLK